MGKFTLRRAWITSYLKTNKRWPTIPEVQRKFPKASKSAIYRDKEQIRQLLVDPAVLDMIRAQVFAKMEERVPELDDIRLVILFLGLIPKQIEQKTEMTGKIHLVPPLDLRDFTPEQRATIREAAAIIKQSQDSAGEG